MKTHNILLGGILGIAIAANIPSHFTLGADASSVLNPYGVTAVAYSSNLIGTTYNVRLGAEMEGPDARSTQQIVNTLETAGRLDTVIFHIAGPGGNVDGMLNMINAVKLSKAHVIMSVEGPAYSAYAVVATQGDELRISDNALMMFHTTSLVNADCDTPIDPTIDPLTGGFDPGYDPEGLDRGVANKIHCAAYKDANMNLANALRDKIKILTAVEKAQIKAGYDVYLTPEEVRERG